MCFVGGAGWFLGGRCREQFGGDHRAQHKRVDFHFVQVRGAARQRRGRRPRREAAVVLGHEHGVVHAAGHDGVEPRTRFNVEEEELG